MRIRGMLQNADLFFKPKLLDGSGLVSRCMVMLEKETARLSVLWSSCASSLQMLENMQITYTNNHFDLWDKLSMNNAIRVIKTNEDCLDARLLKPQFL